jgi:diacylglycerol kinase family enzyme
MDRANNGKINLAKLLINMDNGDYYDENGEIRRGSGVDYKKIRSWRLIPKNNLNESDEVEIDRNLPGYYSIDGERYKIEPIQVNILKKSLRMFCLNPENF